MGTLTDDDLRHLLGEAAGSYDAPRDGADLVLEAVAEEADVIPLHRRRWVQLPAAAVLVTGALLAAVVALDRGDEAQIEQAARPVQAGPQVPVDGGATAPTAQLSGATGGTAVGESAQAQEYAALDAVAAPAPAAARAAAPGGTSSGAKAAPPVTAPVPDGARVVKTGAIALVVEDGRVTPVLTQVQSIAAAAGGEVAVAQTQELGPTPSGSVTLRVPVAAFESVVAKVRSLDAEVRTATTSGKDVTAQYADIEAQIRTLTAARERFLEILSRTRTIGDVLAVQQRVDDVTGRLDRLEGQRRVLASQSERATLEVTVTEADDPVVSDNEKPDDGLGKAFRDAWDGFTSGVEALIRMSGRAILLLMCLAVAYAVLRVGWRASRRRLV